MTISINMLAPSSAPNATYVAKSGNSYVSDVYGVIKSVITGDVDSLLNQDAIPLGQPNTKNNYAGTVAPTSANDLSQDYGVGSFWLIPLLSKAYVCFSAASGAAVWADFSAA